MKFFFDFDGPKRILERIHFLQLTATASLSLKNYAIPFIVENFHKVLQNNFDTDCSAYLELNQKNRETSIYQKLQLYQLICQFMLSAVSTVLTSRETESRGKLRIKSFKTQTKNMLLFLQIKVVESDPTTISISTFTKVESKSMIHLAQMGLREGHN